MEHFLILFDQTYSSWQVFLRLPPTWIGEMVTNHISLRSLYLAGNKIMDVFKNQMEHSNL